MRDLASNTRIGVAISVVVGVTLVGVATRSADSAVEEQDKTAFVSEIPDWRDAGRYTGRFTAHVEFGSDRTEAMPHSKEGESLKAAVIWARARSEVVLVTIGNEPPMSAGETAVDELEPFPATVPKVRDRPSGTAWDGSEQVRTWTLSAQISGGDAGSDIDAALRSVASENEAIRVRGVERRSKSVLATFDVDASGLNPAMAELSRGLDREPMLTHWEVERVSLSDPWDQASR